MTTDIDTLIVALEDRFDAADDTMRALVLADLHSLIARNHALGHALPPRLVDLERRMVEAADDDGFDNMPV